MTVPPQTVDYIPASHGDSVLKALTTDFSLPQLRQPTPNADPNATPADMSPHAVPLFPTHRYTFAGEIARGGMGAVLRGRDEDLGREIAVKVMLDAHRGKTEYLQRFIAEARIAGQLQHPGVTPVYELGRFPDNLPYIAMKLVQGDTLATLLKERPRGADATPLATDRSRFLKIFEQICQTLHYAHASGVIHRDLKPQNIMVGAFAEVQVMDWGLAKMLRQGDKETRRQGEEARDTSPAEGMTRAGALLGTPAYVAPEQARGDMDQVDTRSDVFSLGAILGEILTGKFPYAGPSVPEMIAQARAGELSTAFARLDACGADTELIALAKRCLAPDPADRPRDAGELVKELTAYLQGVEQRLRHAELTAVEAKTKAVEEAKRRKVTFRLAAGILLAVLAGLAASLWQMSEAKAAEQVAKGERDEKEKARAAEEKERVAALNRLDQVETGGELLASIFKDLDKRRIENEGGRVELVLGNRLKQAASQLRGKNIGDPLLVAKLQHTLGSSLLGLGDFAAAIPLLEESHQVRLAGLGADHDDTLTTLNSLGAAHRDAGQFSRAATLFAQAHTGFLKRFGPDHPSAVVALNNLALAMKANGQVNQAIAHWESLHDAMLKQMETGQPHALIILNNLASAWLDVREVDRALRLLEQVRDVQIRRLGSEHMDTLTTQSNLANAYRAVGRLGQAIALLEAIKDIELRKFTIEHPHTLGTLNNLAAAYNVARRPDKALPLLEMVYPAAAKRFGVDHPNTLVALNNLAESYRVNGQAAKAIPMFEQVRQAQLLRLGAGHPAMLTTLGNLALAYQNAGRLNDALPLFEQVMVGMEKLQFRHEHAAQLLNNTCRAYEVAQRLDRAEFWQRKWVAALKQQHGPEHPIYLGELATLGFNLLLLQKWSAAETPLHECLTVRERKQPNEWTTFNTKSMLGGSLLGQQKYAEAEPLLLQGYEGMKQRKDKIPPQGLIRLTQALERLIQLYDVTGKPDEAAKWRKELETLKSASSPGKP